MGRILRPPRGGGPGGRPLARFRRRAERPLPRGRAGARGRPAGDDRPRALRRRSRARAGPGRCRRGAPDEPARRAAAGRAPLARGCDRPARAGRAHRRPSRSGGQPARGAGGADLREAQPELHAGSCADRRPHRKVRSHGRQPGGRRPRGAGADDAGLGGPDLRQLRCRRAGDRAGAPGDSRCRRQPHADRPHPRADGDRRHGGNAARRAPAADRQQGRRPQRHRARARQVRQRPGRADPGPVRPHPARQGESDRSAAGVGAGHRNGPEQEVRAGGRRRRQGRLPRGGARSGPRGLAHRGQGARARRPRHRQRIAAGQAGHSGAGAAGAMEEPT